MSPYSTATVIFIDYTLNAVGLALAILGLTLVAIFNRTKNIRKLASVVLIAIGVLSDFAGYGVYQIYLSIPPIGLGLHPAEPYFPATNVPVVGLVYVVPLFRSLIIDGGLFISAGLILLILGKNRNHGTTRVPEIESMRTIR